MKIHIEINAENAAFEDNGFGREASIILRKAIEKLADMQSCAPRDVLLFDSNGNRVGRCQVK